MPIVWRLVSGFLRRSWKGTLFLGLMVFLMSSLLLADWRDQGGWASFDLARLFVIVLMLAGRFFSGREVVALPISRRDLWRARWLLAALGIPSIAEASRLAFRLFLYRHLMVPIDWRG